MNEAPLNTMVALLIATSAAIAVIALLRPAARRYCGSVAVLRLWWMLPLSFAAALVPKKSTPVWTESILLSQTSIAETTIGAVAAVEFPWKDVVFAAWALGSLATAAWLFLAQRRYLHNVIWGAGRRGVLPAGSDPAVVGAIAPRLVLPADFAARYSAHERRLILLHERIHLRRGDGLANLAMSTLLVVQWFNPLVHWATRALCRDQECACDALIISRHPHALKTYTEALMKSLPGPARHLPLVSRWLAYHPTVERISMLIQHRDLRNKVKLLAGLFVAGLSLTSAIVYAVRPATNVLAEFPRAGAVVAPAPQTTVSEPATPPTAAVVAPSSAPAPQRAVLRVAQAPAEDRGGAAPTKAHFHVKVKLTMAKSDGTTPPGVSRQSREFSVVMQEQAKMMVGFPDDVRLTMSAMQADNGILLRALIESGPEHKVVAEPSILVTPGEPGTIEVGSRESTGLTDGFRLEVTVNPITAEQADAFRANARVAAPAPNAVCQADTAGIAAALNATLPAGVTPLSIRRSGNNIELRGEAISSVQVATAMRMIEQSAYFERPELSSLRKSPNAEKPTSEFEMSLGLKCAAATASL